jgi:hypothetical protein
MKIIRACGWIFPLLVFALGGQCTPADKPARLADQLQQTENRVSFCASKK